MFKIKYTITTDYIRPLANPPRRRSGRAMRVKFIVAHDSGNFGSTAKNNVKYYKDSYNHPTQSSAHTFIDDKDIIECIPLTIGTPEEAHHVLESRPKDNELYGGDSNRIGAGIELCFGGKVNTMEAYKRYVWYIAYCLYKFNIPVRGYITGHYILDPGRKADPITAFKLIGKSWADFLADVEKEYKECTGQTPSIPLQQVEGWKAELGIQAVKDLAKLTYDGGKQFIDPTYWEPRIKSGEMAWYKPIFMLRAIKVDKIPEGGNIMANDNLNHGLKCLEELSKLTYDGGKPFLDYAFWENEMKAGKMPWYEPVFILRSLKVDKGA